MKVTDFTMANVTIEATEGEYYGSYGRGPGKRPPVTPIFEWVKKYNIVEALKPYSQLSFAFAVATNIGKFGTKTTPNNERIKDYEDTVNKAIDDTVGVAIEHELTQALS